MQTRRDGIALVLVVLLVMVTATVATSAAMLGSSSWLLSQYKERQSSLAAIADAGLEEGRARINGNKALYPDSLYNTIENAAAVTDASGKVIPGVRRWTYAGPIGVTTGQYGVFGSVVTVAETSNGDRVVRRLEVVQESFSKFAYFTDVEPSSIAFGGGDQLFGPVHSNDNIRIYSSGATFHGPVTTGGTISGRNYGTFNAGYTERVKRISMPQTADLDKLRNYAQNGGTSFVSTTSGTMGEVSMRIEFVNVDLNNDGDATDDDEGFLRVYRHAGVGTPTTAQRDWVSAHATPATTSNNCGDVHASDGIFYPASAHPNSYSGAINQNDVTRHTRQYSITTHPGRICYLGGDPRINGTTPQGRFVPGTALLGDGNGGYWLPWAGPVDPRLNSAHLPQAIRDARGYLFPLSRNLNPGFKGVVFVEGNVGISGTLRSRITLAATGDIVILDDTRYSVDPGAGSCKDILGIFAGDNVVVSDNAINAPQNVSSSYRTYDETTAEFVHGVVLALNNFTVENYNSGSSNAEPCGTTSWGRGCLFLTGGIIQRERGAVGTGGGTGYLKRYSYDPCAFSSPPPYFPTTGHFARSRIFDVESNNFSIAKLFNDLTPN